MQNSAIYVKRSLKINMLKIKNFVMLEINIIMQVNIELLHIAYVVQNIVYLKKLLWIVNSSNYDYRFTKKEPAEEFEGWFTCLGENTQKHILF